MANRRSKKWKTVIVVLAVMVAGIGVTWKFLQKPDLPEGFASGNGRTETTEVDITTKYGGRLAEVLPKEGDAVERHQVLARFDTKELEAQFRRAQAEVRRAKQERSYAVAVIAQRKSELSLTLKDLQRSKGLYETDSISFEKLQRDQTAVETAKATLAASRAQFTSKEVETRTEREKLMFRVKVKIDPDLLEKQTEWAKSGLPGVDYVRLVRDAEWPEQLLPPGGSLWTGWLESPA